VGAAQVESQQCEWNFGEGPAHVLSQACAECTLVWVTRYASPLAAYRSANAILTSKLLTDLIDWPRSRIGATSSQSAQFGQSHALGGCHIAQ
jgi:hypothetical protein